MPRYELPPDLTPEEQRIVLSALERIVELERPELSPWVLAGRAETLRLGRLHVRHQVERPHAFPAPIPFVTGGTRPRVGRGDSR